MGSWERLNSKCVHDKYFLKSCNDFLNKDNSLFSIDKATKEVCDASNILANSMSQILKPKHGVVRQRYMLKMIFQCTDFWYIYIFCEIKA